MTVSTLKAPARRAMRPQAISSLRARLRDAEELLRAFNRGEIDALVRSSPSGQQIYTLKGADHVYRMMVETMSEGAVTLTPDGVILYANRRFAEMLGTDLDTVMGRRLQEFVEPALEAFLDDLLQGSANAPTRGALPLRQARCAPVSVNLAMHRLDVDGMQCIVVIVTDLTELERSRAEIERLRTDFVSTVSHELRTPLTSISGSLALVQSGAMGALPERAAAMVRIAHENSGRLMRIINDILDIGTLEAGKMVLQMGCASLRELLQQSVQSSSGHAILFQVRFVLDHQGRDDQVTVDPHRLVQVVANLLSNAAKFSPPGADVLIRVLPGPAMLRVEVENSGPAIAPEFQGRIFEKFAQADASATRRFDGTGLGLSIARKLMEAMGGAIGFTSGPGPGTVFHIDIPRTGPH